jgi:ABC-type uncharacterized transport system involved in gliding motility auxiliary subunit
VSLVLVGLLVVAVVALGQRLRLRADLTEEGIYSLSDATVGLLGELEDRLQVKLYFNRDIEGAEGLLPQRVVLEDFLDEVAARGGGRVSVETVDPTTDLVARRDAEHVGVTPLTLQGGGLGGVSVDLVYQGVELRYRGRSEVIPFAVPSEFEFAFAVRLSELLRSARPAIAFVSDEPPMPPPLPGVQNPIPADRVYQDLRDVLQRRYAVRDVDLQDPEALAEDVVAVIIARPQEFQPDALRVLDRYLASGGHVLVMAEPERVDSRTLAHEARATGLADWLGGYGVRIGAEVVYDEESIQVPAGTEVVETPSGPQMRRIVAPYGLGPQLSAVQGSYATDHVVTGSLDSVTLFSAHPVQAFAMPDSLETETLLRSSPRSWLLPASVSRTMDLENLEALRATALQSGLPAASPLCIALQGVFPAAFAHEDFEPAPGLLVVLGDTDALSNIVLANAGAPNRDFAANLLDWMAQDEALVGLRSRGKRERRIPDFRTQYVERQGGWASTDEENRELDREAAAYARGRERTLTWGNVLGPPLVVLLLGLAHRAFYRRRERRPFRAGGGEGKS